ncbi:hypothetical protein [Nocardiopsis sp. TSRI0078]|uniref:hypothetical protein n=1 Tax=Nocardiopsis sp. TSRI0078 TaxID=1718951 RepID=UPI0018FE68B0|nr:hypothetical protein [Nocardiopsis sp. TSRI0078]
MRDSRLDDAIAVVETRPDPWTGPRIVRARLPSAVGRLAGAAAELRDPGTIKARGELFEALVQQGRAAGAITTHPTVAEQRAVKAKTESVPLREDGYSAEPPF